MSAIVRRKKLIFTAFVCTPSPKDALPACPIPLKFGFAFASHHDLTAAKEQYLELPNTTLIADLAYPELEFELSLNGQNTHLLTGCKKPKGKDLTKFEKYHNRLIRRIPPTD